MPEKLIMRGQTASGKHETLSFGGHKDNHAYRITEFILYPSTLNQDFECCGAITAGKTAVDPLSPTFDDAGIIATGFMGTSASQPYPVKLQFVINDQFYITQDLILSVTDTSSNTAPVNWQCKFEKVKLSDSAQAVANYNQSTIYE
tara:strand:- start:393 stop:830 length:438 start_codon:yes stop_codon:yes gene_type:complete